MQSKRHWFERVFWSIAFAASVIACFYSIWSIWSKWDQHPVIVTFDDKTTSVGKIPFPAVTICSSQKFNMTKLDIAKISAAIADMHKNEATFFDLPPKTVTQMDVFLQICSASGTFPKNASLPSKPTIFETMRDIMPDEKSIIFTAMWATMLQQLNFEPIFTEEGLCYTFNSLNSHEIYSDEASTELLTVRHFPNSTYWNMEDGYRPNVNETLLYPYQTFGSGVRNSLFLFLTIFLDVTHRFCSPFAPGFRLSLHAPDDLPRMNRDFIHIAPEQDVYVSIKPNVMTTSKGLRKYSSHVRGCYFKSERKLNFFRTYTQKKCAIECFSNYTRKVCGCVQYSMPRDKSTKVCTMLDMSCALSAETRFDRDLVVHECDCIPECCSIGYNVEMSQAQSSYFDITSKYSSDASKKFGYLTLTKLFLSFKENHFISVNRSEITTMPNFISQCGGLMGLFMGISLLSVIELVYFFTLRLCCKLRRHQTFSMSENETWARRNHLSIVTN